MQFSRYIAIFFLFMYTIGIANPFICLGSYQLEKDFIAENLCVNKNNPASQCNGKCYLLKNITKAEEGESASDQLPGFVITQKGEFSLHVLSAAADLCIAEYMIATCNCRNNNIISDSNIQIVLPPPESV